MEVLKMLLDFKISNYKSFFEQADFFMMPAPRQTGLDFSIQRQKVGAKTYRALSSAVIYGPNASGKTNLIGAMDTMRAIVLRGHIKDTDPTVTANPASAMLELIPNQGNSPAPTSFYIRFLENGLVVEYSLSLQLGEFLDKDFRRKIIEEKLSVNEHLVFIRTNHLKLETSSAIEQYLNPSVMGNLNTAIKIAESGLNDEELFLCNGYKTIFSKELVSMILNWFENKFMVIYRSDSLKAMRKFADPKDNTVYVDKTLTLAAKEFGITANALGYRIDGERAELCSIVDGHGQKAAIPAELFESYGTLRFVNEFPLIIRALLNGATLVMDEFDASIHPMALMNIISIFHNDEINKKHAQLIFNTHNPIFLDASLFRRDEIKFVERDETTNCSVHYALSDFKTANGVRKGEAYMNNYFVNRYGAIKDVDFSSILKEIIDASEVKKDD
jgi:abortive infection family protein